MTVIKIYVDVFHVRLAAVETGLFPVGRMAGYSVAVHAVKLAIWCLNVEHVNNRE